MGSCICMLSGQVHQKMKLFFLFLVENNHVLTLKRHRESAALCRKYTLPCRQQNKWSSSYQSEENNNPGLHLSLAVNDRCNYAHIARQANRITVRFSLWLGCHSPIIVASPDWSSPSPSPLPFTACLVSSFSYCLASVCLCFSPGLLLQANESEADGSSLAPARPLACFRVLFCFFSAQQCLHSPASRGEFICPSLFSHSPANTFTTFKLATVTTNHASRLHVSRCCGLLFFPPPPL